MVNPENEKKLDKITDSKTGRDSYTNLMPSVQSIHILRGSCTKPIACPFYQVPFIHCRKTAWN
ncbi:MAG: hypothetical protein GYA75_08135 [Bacteroidales bacterium]|nr:hypothetical protein [Bacteroidales bacterium]